MRNKLHRENNPAHIKYYKDKLIEEFYYINNNLHRENKPAHSKFYKNGNIYIEEYYIKGKLHREDGPAWIEYYDNIIKETYFVRGLFIKRQHS